eukprot:scaffold5126_cov125-Isochrysis_galbana.AAC.2
MKQSVQQRWSQLRAYHRLVILVLLATVWAVIALSGMHAFVHSSSDPTRRGWQPVSAAGLVPRSLDSGDNSADGGNDNAVLEHLGSLLETVQTGRLSRAQRVQLEDRLQRALLKLEHAVVDMDGMGGPNAGRNDAAVMEASAVVAASEAGGTQGDSPVLQSDRGSTGGGLRSGVDANIPLDFAAGSAAVAQGPPEEGGGRLRLEQGGADAEGLEGEGWDMLEREAVLEE